MKGIILAGGKGTRLYPITKAVSKVLMPVYDKPMVYYPLATLISAGIREILIITTPKDKDNFQALLGDGSDYGCEFQFVEQQEPRGLAAPYIVGEDFIGKDKVTMILGDNIFYGTDIGEVIHKSKDIDGAMIFAYEVSDPKRYGIVEFDKNKKVVSIEEKPEVPKSNYAQTGIFVSDNNIIKIAKSLKPSDRGELEVTHAMQEYLNRGKLQVSTLPRGTAWLDTGTFDSMNAAALYVQVLEERQGIKVGCIEEEAFRQGFINEKQIRKLAEPLTKSGYGQYLLSLLDK